MTNIPSVNLYGGLSADQYKSLVTPQNGSCFSELGLFFRRLGHAIFNFEWVTDSKLANRFYKHFLNEQVSITDSKAQEVYNLFSKSLFETNQADTLQKRLGISTPGSKYTAPANKETDSQAPANKGPATPPTDASTSAASNTATQAAEKRPAEKETSQSDKAASGANSSPTTNSNPAQGSASTSAIPSAPAAGPTATLPVATAVNSPASTVNLTKPADTNFTISAFPAGLWFIARQTAPEDFDLKIAPQPRIQRYLEDKKDSVEFTQAKAKAFLQDKRKFFESLDDCIQGSKKLIFKHPYYKAWLMANDAEGFERYQTWIAANPDHEQKLLSKDTASQLIRDMPMSSLMRLVEVEANKIKAQLNSFDELLNPHLNQPNISIPRSVWERYKFNDAFENLLKVMYQIEDSLGITAAVKNHLHYMVYQCYGKDPIAKTALGEYNVTEATAGSLRDDTEVLKTYIQKRFPMLLLKWGRANFGTEEKAFDIMLKLVFPEYNNIELQALPLSLYDFQIKDPYFGDDMQEKNRTTFYKKDVNYSLPSFEAEREVNDASGSRKYKERILVVGVFSNTGGHFVSTMLDNEEQYVTHDSFKPDNPSKSTAVDFSVRAKFGVPENTSLTVRISSDDPSIPAFVPHRPNASYWKVPQQSNNNCYLVAALMRLATFNFYYRQYKNAGFYQASTQA